MFLFNSIFFFILTIAILVVIHELGHFLAAKFSRMRVDAFAVGFGQRLFGWNKKSKFTFGSLPKEFDLEGNTDYRLNLIPLGGYVKIAGMIDESMDKEFLNKEPQPWEFRSSTTGKKLFVISAGVLMNFLLAFLIFWGINFFQGKQHIKTTEVGYVSPGSLAQKAGFMQSDRIIAVNDNKVYYWDEVLTQIFIKKIGEDINVTIQRDGKLQNIIINRNLIPSDEKTARTFLLPAGIRPVITQIMGNSPASSSGLQEGDIILSINDTITMSDQQVVNLISSNPNSQIKMLVLRNKDSLNISVTPGSDGKIGIGIGSIIDAPVEYKSFNFLSSAVESASDIYKNIILFFEVISKVSTGKVEFGKAFGGPIKIAQMAGKTAEGGMITFLSFISLLSISLAIINILPFPVLDGGHIIIIALEGIIRREISPKIKIAIQNAGFIILLLFMAYVIYNDILHL